MKKFAFAAALLISTAAMAQMPMAAPTTPPADTMAPAAPAQPSDTTTPPAAAEVAPAASDPASAPMPAAGRAETAQAPSTAPAPVAQASYPRCSATVTDQCRQSSARESDRKGGPRKSRG